MLLQKPDGYRYHLILLKPATNNIIYKTPKFHIIIRYSVYRQKSLSAETAIQSRASMLIQILISVTAVRLEQTFPAKSKRALIFILSN